MERMLLIGSEDISRAGHNIVNAASTMQACASSIEESNSRLIRALEEHALRIERAMEPRNDNAL